MQGMISIDDINAILSYDGLCVDVEPMLEKYVAYLRFSNEAKWQLGYAYGDSAQQAANRIYLRYLNGENHESS